jgi:uncharacterized protein (TIGR02145 family)
MKKTIFLGFLALLCGLSMLSAQVGINTETPQATLDVVASKTDGSTAEGVIAPRLTGDQIKIKDAQYNVAQKGAIVYATAKVGTASPKTANITAEGYYYFDGSVWVGMAVGSTSALKITVQPKAFSWSRKYDAYGDPTAPASPTIAPLSVTAVGNGLTYKWCRKSKNRNNPSVTVVSTSGSTYAPPVTAWGMESYYVVVKNNAGDSVVSNIAEVALGCGAKTVDGGWLKVACYNHGVTIADKSNDPFTYKTGTDEGSTSVKYYGAGGILGPFYQWGRNDSVPRTNVGNVTGPLPTTGGTAGTNSLAKGDNQLTAGNATTWGNFITGTDATYNCDWRQGAWDYLWYANRQTPCPNGWWNPTQTDWGSITSGGTNRILPTNAANAMEWATGFRFKPDGSTTTLFLPAAGYRYYNGAVNSVSTSGTYWSSTVAASMAFLLNFFNGYLSQGDAISRGTGRSVRCVQQ